MRAQAPSPRARCWSLFGGTYSRIVGASGMVGAMHSWNHPSYILPWNAAEAKRALRAGSPVPVLCIPGEPVGQGVDGGLESPQRVPACQKCDSPEVRSPTPGESPSTPPKPRDLQPPRGEDRRRARPDRRHQISVHSPRRRRGHRRGPSVWSTAGASAPLPRRGANSGNSDMSSSR
eukprot:gene17352-biopygen9833